MFVNYFKAAILLISAAIPIIIFDNLNQELLIMTDCVREIFAFAFFDIRKHAFSSNDIFLPFLRAMNLSRTLMATTNRKSP